MWQPPPPGSLVVPEFVGWDDWPFEPAILRVRPVLAGPVPEPARAGEDPRYCAICRGEAGPTVWEDADWRLLGRLPTSLPGSCMLVPQAHVDSFVDMPADLLAAIGPVIARVERAILTLDDVARVHVLRYGDGSAHFHLHLLPRPAGALQLRGTMAQLWEDVLPPVAETVAMAALRCVASAMDATPC